MMFAIKRGTVYLGIDGQWHPELTTGGRILTVVNGNDLLHRFEWAWREGVISAWADVVVAVEKYVPVSPVAYREVS